MLLLLKRSYDYYVVHPKETRSGHMLSSRICDGHRPEPFALLTGGDFLRIKADKRESVRLAV